MYSSCRIFIDTLIKWKKIFSIVKNGVRWIFNLQLNYHKKEIRSVVNIFITPSRYFKCHQTLQGARCLQEFHGIPINSINSSRREPLRGFCHTEDFNWNRKKSKTKLIFLTTNRLLWIFIVGEILSKILQIKELG